MEGKFELKILESRVFLLMLGLGIVETVIFLIEVNLFYFLPQTVLYRGVFTGILSAYVYLFQPILVFIVFYFVLGNNFPEKTGSTVISLLVGSIVGRCIGGFAMSGILSLANNEISFASALYQFVYQLATSVQSDLMLAFTAMAAYWLVRWFDKKLLEPSVERNRKRPPTVTAVSVIYIVFGVLTLSVLPFIFYASALRNSSDLPLLVGTVVLFVIVGIVQLMIARGIFMGRRWGWVAAFIISLVSLAEDITLLVIGASVNATHDLTFWILTVGTIISLISSLPVLGLLLSSDSRTYCRIVNLSSTEGSETPTASLTTNDKP